MGADEAHPTHHSGGAELGVDMTLRVRRDLASDDWASGRRADVRLTAEESERWRGLFDDDHDTFVEAPDREFVARLLAKALLGSTSTAAETRDDASDGHTVQFVAFNAVGRIALIVHPDQNRLEVDLTFLDQLMPSPDKPGEVPDIHAWTSVPRPTSGGWVAPPLPPPRTTPSPVPHPPDNPTWTPSPAFGASEVVQPVVEMAASGVIGGAAWAAIARLKPTRWWSARRAVGREDAHRLARQAINAEFKVALTPRTEPSVEEYAGRRWRVVYAFAGSTYTASGHGAGRGSISVSRVTGNAPLDLV